MKALLKTFRENLLHHMREQNLNQKDLADKLGVAPQAINSYIRGHRTPGLDVLQKLSSGLGVAPDQLLTPLNAHTKSLEKSLHQHLSEETVLTFYNYVKIIGGWGGLFKLLEEEVKLIEKNKRESLSLFEEQE